MLVYGKKKWFGVCMYTHAYMYSAEGEVNDSRERPFHKKKKLEVTTLCRSNHMESTETYSAPFQVKGKKIKRIS